MNTIKHFVVSLAVVLCFAVTSQAAETKKKNSISSVPVTAPATSLSGDLPSSASLMHSPARSGFGFQTLPAQIGDGTPSISYLYDREDFQIQGYFTVADSDPFRFALGGIYRRTFYGTGRAGFHFGGGAAIGTDSAIVATAVENKMFVHAMGVVGIHFESPSLPNFMFTMDGGPQLYIFNGSSSLRLNAFSPALGLGLHYFI